MRTVGSSSPSAFERNEPNTAGWQGKRGFPEVADGAQISSISRRARIGIVVGRGRERIDRVGEGNPVDVPCEVLQDPLGPLHGRTTINPPPLGPDDREAISSNA